MNERMKKNDRKKEPEKTKCDQKQLVQNRTEILFEF